MLQRRFIPQIQCKKRTTDVFAKNDRHTIYRMSKAGRKETKRSEPPFPVIVSPNGLETRTSSVTSPVKISPDPSPANRLPMTP